MSHSAMVAMDLTKEPDFLSWVGMEIGSRLYTITAWESAGESAERGGE